MTDVCFYSLKSKNVHAKDHSFELIACLFIIFKKNKQFLGLSKWELKQDNDQQEDADMHMQLLHVGHNFTILQFIKTDGWIKFLRDRFMLPAFVS